MFQSLSDIGKIFPDSSVGKQSPHKAHIKREDRKTSIIIPKESMWYDEQKPGPKVSPTTY